MSATIKPSNNPVIECVKIGSEQQPVLIIDNFLQDPLPLIDTASKSHFATEHKFYPGVRCPAPELYTLAMQSILPELLEQYFAVKPGDISRADSSFSLVTTPPEKLFLLQKLPHFDSNNPKELASIYFLCNQHQDQYSGTAFFRHRQTGFEFVDQTRYGQYMSTLKAQVEQKRPGPGYIQGDTELFEQIAYFPAKFNRLLLYRCTSLHSGRIEPDFNFSTNPQVARLSINTFLGN
ncbi:DUF6445 family protein [Gilvimarinus sp. SDUM040013]|uniref:DUF6445 family protein n=1 Tax=Gilvimarinus gilvus TaxID=3058038 RepID=A0ABU4RTI2_9GAMM|nr:DUF6445 family protein [Gilvimarinus sp. SDUM040013]MDO3386924.1 DUF6445 family protein [Gilvimarinus sp. SDUM040013]MDX6848182.1 DUF6445 family protein [Gilvimarinus sp. SDUM040013]